MPIPIAATHFLTLFFAIKINTNGCWLNWRQINNLRHATNSELLCEAFLHAFTGQPLPNDDDLRKDNPNRVPAEARRIMEEMGIDPSFENDVSEDDWYLVLKRNGALL